MEQQFTIEHYSHIKKNGFRPEFCRECQDIDTILNKTATSSITTDLYEALTMVAHQLDSGNINKAQIYQALAKAEESLK